MWRWQKRFPLCVLRNISRSEFVAPTVRKPCGFWTELEWAILRWKATNFHEIGMAREEQENGQKKQLLGLASSRNAEKNEEAAEVNAQNCGIWFFALWGFPPKGQNHSNNFQPRTDPALDI